MKYSEIINPLLFDIVCCEIKRGSGLPILNTKKYPDFVYWDDSNELVHRLKILVASKDAGNNASHNNETISIIEELEQAGIIKH